MISRSGRASNDDRKVDAPAVTYRSDGCPLWEASKLHQQPAQVNGERQLSVGRRLLGALHFTS